MFAPHRRSFDAPPLLPNSPDDRRCRGFALTALFAPASTFGAGRRGGGHAADSIKYVYPNTPQLEKLKAEAAHDRSMARQS